MTSIVSYFQHCSFGPLATRAMGEAFDNACKNVAPGEPVIVKEIIAKRIISAAVNGERDPERLCKIASRDAHWVIRSADRPPMARQRMSRSGER